jgi:hypothetical protein
MSSKRWIYIILGFAVAAIILRPQFTVPILVVTGFLWGIIVLLTRVSAPKTLSPSNRLRKSEPNRRRSRDHIPQNLPGLFSDQKLIAEISTLTGSRDVTKRLIESYRQRFPNESEQWRREKIIYDLKRDRGKI